MSTHQIHIFVSHSWSYSSHYDTLAKWIFEGRWSAGQASFNFLNFSVPKDDPVHNANNDAQLEKAIFNKIMRSHVIVIPTGMYANYSKWIKREIAGAKKYEKPILAVNPWGQIKSSSVVANSASEIVGWNQQPIINNIWKLYKA